MVIVGVRVAYKKKINNSATGRSITCRKKVRYNRSIRIGLHRAFKNAVENISRV